MKLSKFNEIFSRYGDPDIVFATTSAIGTEIGDHTVVEGINLNVFQMDSENQILSILIACENMPEFIVDTREHKAEVIDLESQANENV